MQKRTFIYILFCLIFFIGFYLRVRHLTTHPGWFRDEGTYFEVSRSIMNGQPKVGAINCTFVSPFMTHPPLFFFLNSIWFQFFNDDIQSFRRFSVSCNLLTIIFIFLIGLKIGDAKLALLSSAIFSLHPTCVLFSRMALPYHLYALFGVIIFYAAINYLETKTYQLQITDNKKNFLKNNFFWLLVCVFCSSLSIITVYYSWVFFAFVLVLIISAKKWKHLISLIIIPIPLTLFLILSVLLQVNGFREDLMQIIKANKGGTTLQTLMHYKEFFGMGVIFCLGSVGLLFIKNAAYRWFIVLFSFLIMHVVLKKQDTMISFINYPVIPILPFLSIGLASFLIYIYDEIIKSSVDKLNLAAKYKYALNIAIILLGMMLFLPSVIESFSSKKTGFKTPLDFGMVKNRDDAYQAAAFVNSYSNKDSLVIATSNLWHILDTKKYTDLYQSLAYNGNEWDFYLYQIPKDRFLFDPSLSGAMFLIEDGFTQLRSGKVPGFPPNPVKDKLTEVETSWIKAKEIGEYTIYLNPKFKDEFDKKNQINNRQD